MANVLSNLGGLIGCEDQTELLFFFLILVVLFQGPCGGLFGDQDELLLFFLLLVILFCGPTLFGGFGGF